MARQVTKSIDFRSVAGLDPGSGAFLIWDEQPGSYFLELRNHILPKFFDADPGSGMEKSRIRDKHPGFATLDLPPKLSL